MNLNIAKYGVRIGNSFWDATSYPYPFVEVNIIDIGIELNFLFSKLIINREYINTIDLKHFLWLPYVKIIHDSPDLDKFIILWIKKITLKQLEENQFKVT